MTQPEFVFDDAPAQQHSPTSQEAAAAMDQSGRLNALRRSVLDFVLLMGEEGATDEEIQVSIPMKPNTERPRRVELVRAGLIRDSGKKRKGTSGHQAVVWVAIPQKEKTDEA